MARIQFKAKPRAVWNATGETIEFHIIDVPTLTRKHCDMNAFRSHPKYGAYANSDLFPAMLLRLKTSITKPGGWLRVDQLPANVTIDTSGFLATVTIEA